MLLLACQRLEQRLQVSLQQGRWSTLLLKAQASQRQCCLVRCWWVEQLRGWPKRCCSACLK